MKIDIFLLCYNEELLLPHTLKFYKTNFPNGTIHIVDNYSTDSSCDIAENNGCKIIKYDSNEQQDERRLIWVRSHIWKKHVTSGWVIMCDMDEWLNITEMDLENEENNGKTIINTNGVNMVGESNTIDFSDINLFEITKGVYDERFSKKICFNWI
jgi:glycosyltransferase involved in cell wall biosynthesis